MSESSPYLNPDLWSEEFRERVSREWANTGNITKLLKEMGR